MSIILFSLSGCDKKINLPGESSKNSTVEQQNIETYIKPYLGIVFIDQFDKNYIPSADDLINLYSDSNNSSKDETISASKLESFITDAFDISTEQLQASKKYNADSKKYTLELCRLGNFVSLDITDIELLENGNRFTFEYKEKGFGDDDTITMYTYVLDVEYVDDGFKFISGKNIKTDYDVES